MYKNRGQALTKCIVHVLPVSASLAIVGLNIVQFYVGGELRGPGGYDVQKLAALQFAAKLHELLMLASLGAIVFTMIRKELAFGEGGIPFGALFAGFQIDKISLLWSSEFWGTLTHKWRFRRRTKLYLVSLIVVCTLLGVSVGPSSANLIKPRLDFWAAGGTTFWINATEDQLYPTFTKFSPAIAHCDVDSGDAACPHGGWESINQQYLSFWPQLYPGGSMPEGFEVSSPFSLREVLVRQRTTTDDTFALWANAFTLATTQMSAPADGLTEVGRLWALAAARAPGIQRFNYRKDATFTITTSQPFVMARCEESTVNLSRLTDLELNFPVLSSLQLTGSTATNSDAILTSVVSVNDSTTLDLIIASLSSGPLPRLVWFDSSTAVPASNSSINVIATFPNTTSGMSSIYICGIESRLAANDISSSRNEPKHVTGAPPDWWDTGIVPSWPRITIASEWAKLLNPSIPGQDSTVFSEMTSTAGMWNTSLASQPYNYPFIVESILSTMVANGLARYSYNTSMIGTLKLDDLWYKNFLPSSGRIGWGGDAYTVTDDERQAATMFTMYAADYGYAYSNHGATQKAAIVVLLVYSILAMGHVCYSGKTGWTSTAWDTMPEIAALAMSSKQTAKLRNTGTGIYTVGVYQEAVRTRVREQHVEFVFNDTKEGSDTIIPNEKYA